MACAGSVCIGRDTNLAKGINKQPGHARSALSRTSTRTCGTGRVLRTVCLHKQSQPHRLPITDARKVLDFCTSLHRVERCDSRVKMQPCLCCQQQDEADQTQLPASDSCQSGNRNLSNTANSRSMPTRLAVSAISAYKSLISPLLPNVCRFQPTCSSYGIEAYEQFGAAKGSILLVWRLLRCNPFRGGYQGQYDPPAWPPVGLEWLFGTL